MLIDARRLDHGSRMQTDVLIIGAGAAGLVLATELEAAGIEVILAEAGGERRDRAAFPPPIAQQGPQALNLTGRRRMLGGALNDWGGNCALLDKADFGPSRVRAMDGATETLPDWPFPLSELNERTGRVEACLGLQPGALAGTMQPQPPPAGLDGTGQGRFRARRYLRAAPEAVLDGLRRNLLRDDCRARLLTHATCVGLSAPIGCRRVSGAELASAPQHRISVAARRVVLAAGMENAMLLMQGVADGPEGCLRRWPALGRYLHAHLLALHGVAPLAPGLRALMPGHCLPADFGLDVWRHLGRRARRRLGPGLPARQSRPQPVPGFAGLQLDPARRRAEGMLNGVAWLAPVWPHHPMIGASARRDAARLGPQRLWHSPALHPLLGDVALPRAVALRHYVEQVPRPEARLRPGPARDAFGRFETLACWQSGAAEVHTIARQTALAAEALRGAGMVPFDAAMPPDASDPDIARNAHPMGGTLTGTDPKYSVVDADLAVHGIANLHVCGGSVIPRGGAAMVTGVILQLAFRLADHLRRAP